MDLSCRLHAKEYPNSLVSLNMEGQVTLGHLNLPIKMRYTTSLLGSVIATSLPNAHITKFQRMVYYVIFFQNRYFDYATIFFVVA